MNTELRRDVHIQATVIWDKLALEHHGEGDLKHQIVRTWADSMKQLFLDSNMYSAPTL